jgi:hypothetical protein
VGLHRSGGDDHLGPAASQLESELATDAATGPGDDGNLARKNHERATIVGIIAE